MQKIILFLCLLSGLTAQDTFRTPVDVTRPPEVMPPFIPAKPFSEELPEAYDEWKPAAETMPYGEFFTQHRTRRITTRSGMRTAYGEEYNVVFTVREEIEERTAVGTQITWVPFSEASETFSRWLPTADSVPMGTQFIQTRVKTVTTRRGERNNTGQERNVSVTSSQFTEEQRVTGTMPITPWVRLSETSTAYGMWEPANSSILVGTSFTQGRTVSTTIRTWERNLFNGDTRDERIERSNTTESRMAMGSMPEPWQAFKDTVTTATDWSPSLADFDLGMLFVQTRTVTVTTQSGERYLGRERDIQRLTTTNQEQREAKGVRQTGLDRVATRAQVGTTELTTGFLLTQPTKVLIRAIGPSLRSFGVTNPLPDPKLWLHRIGITVTNDNQSREEENKAIFNDNWDLATLEPMRRAGAFPLQPGSLDAAIYVELLPGSYTASVPNTDKGEVLLEIFRL